MFWAIFGIPALPTVIGAPAKGLAWLASQLEDVALVVEVSRLGDAKLWVTATNGEEALPIVLPPKPWFDLHTTWGTNDKISTPEVLAQVDAASWAAFCEDPLVRKGARLAQIEIAQGHASVCANGVLHQTSCSCSSGG